MELGNRKILFVTGKGGVGKSLIAASVAYEESRKGRRVLLAEIGENSYYKDLWSLNSVGHEPQRHPLGFDLAMWSGETCLREYVLHYLKMERLYRLFFENKVMRSLINVAPGLPEIAILGKITSGIRKVGPPLDYDLIVVDSYASGHAIALFNAPKGMMEAIQFGPMGHHSREIQNVLENPALTGYLIATLFEELPVVESLELEQELRRIVGARCMAVGNKALEAPVTMDELSTVAQAGMDPGLREFAGYLLAASDRQQNFSRQLRERFAEVARVPLIFETDPDRLVRRAGECLRGQA